MPTEKTHSLSVKAAHAGSWMVIGRVLTKVIDFSTLLILIHALKPSDFGLIAIAMSVIQIIEAIFEIPVAQAVLGLDEFSDDMLNTAFTLSLIRGFIIALVSMGLAWPLASFYRDPRLVSLYCALAFAPALRGLLSPKMIIFIKHLDFRQDFATMLIGKVFSLVAACVFAFSTHNYWAIAVGTITYPLTTCVISYILAPFRPRLTLCKWRHFRDMMSWNTLSQVFSSLNWQIDKLMLGRFVTPTALGQYSLANDLNAIPVQALTQPLGRPIMAAFAARRDSQNLDAIYYKIASTIMYLGGPIFIVLNCMAFPIVHLILGDKWLAAVPVLEWVALSGILLLPCDPMPALALALNNNRWTALKTFLESLVKIPTLILGVVFFGMMGAVVARLFVSVAVFIFTMFLVKKLINLPVVKQVSAVLRPTFALLALDLCMRAMYFIYNYYLAGKLLLVFSALIVLIGMIQYALFSYLIWKMAGSPEGAESTILHLVKVYLEKVRFLSPSARRV